MDLNNLVSQMRKEFNDRIESALTEEVKRRELDEEELRALASVLPEVIPPDLSQEDLKKCQKLHTDLDKMIGEMAGTAAQLCKQMEAYVREARELNGLLVGKRSDFKPYHSTHRLKFIHQNLIRLLNVPLWNALICKNLIPNQESIFNKMIKNF